MPLDDRNLGARILAWLAKPINLSTMRRWWDIFLLGFFGAGICALLAPALQKVAEGTAWLVECIWRLFEGLLGSGHMVFGVPLVFLVFIGILIVLTCFGLILGLALGVLRLERWKACLLYPPTWFAALWPIILAGFVITHFASAKAKTLREASSLLLLVFAISLILTAIWPFDWKGAFKSFRPRRWEEGNLPTAGETLKGFANDPKGLLIPWLMRDSPIKQPKQDLFESHVRSQRIAELITEHDFGRIGLIGPWGSGKTTVLNIVDFLLHESKSFQRQYRQRWRRSSRGSSWRKRWSPPRILTCRVGAWGFAKEPAVKVVLREAVTELSKHLDCLSLRSMPEKYLAAIKGVAPAWIHASFVIASADSPSQQLKRLDPLLEAINARLVVFIEDLDRNIEMPDISLVQSVKNEGANIRCEFHNDLAARPNGLLFLELESLLDRMADAKRVSFVLAISRGSI